MKVLHYAWKQIATSIEAEVQINMVKVSADFQGQAWENRAKYTLDMGTHLPTHCSPYRTTRMVLSDMRN